MTIYVDPLANWGWILRGFPHKSCHLFSDNLDNEELHKFAESIGLKRSWFQDKDGHPHYDLTAGRRLVAIAKGAKSITFRESMVIWNTHKRRKSFEV